MNLPATSLPAEIVSSVAAWSEAARSALSPATLKAYRVDGATFVAWCQSRSMESMPASPGAVAGFLKAEAESGKSVATIRRRLATISAMHRAANIPSPADSQLVKLVMKGIAKAKGTDQRQAAPLSADDAVTIAAKLGDSPRELRDLALILVGRDLLARSAELVSIEVGHIEWGSPTIIMLRRRKTSTEAKPCAIGPKATAALRHWLEAGEVAEGPVFQSLKRNGRATGRALDPRDVRRIFKYTAQAAGLNHADNVSGHSVRVGMAQDLVSRNIDVLAVAQAGGWSTTTMPARYSAKLAAARGAVAQFYGMTS